LRLASSVTLPLALVSIGGNLTFSKFQRYFNTALLASVIKLIALPLCGYLFLKLFNVDGTPFKVAMIYFALPASTAIFVLSSQLNSDTGLASSSIVLSTIFSLISLSVVLSFFG
jgi:predicted permease